MSFAHMLRLPLLAAIVIASATTVAQPPDAPDGGPEAGPRLGRRDGGPGGGPSPERFTEHAFSFDADADGKLDRTEFAAFAKAFHERRRGGPGGPGGPGGGGPGGDRPQRPARPE